MNTSLGSLPLNVIMALVENELSKVKELAEVDCFVPVSMTFPDPCDFGEDSDEQINVTVEIDDETLRTETWELYWTPSEAEFTTLRRADQ